VPLGFAAAEPASDASFTPPGLRRGRLDPPRDPGLITPGRAGQTPPVDFCNHHGSQARPQTLTRLPCTPRKGSPPCAALRQAASHFRASAGRAFSNPGAGMVLRARQHPSGRLLAGELCPEPIGPDTSCYGSMPALSRRSWTRRSGTMSPRSRRRTAHEAPSAQGHTIRSLPRRRSWNAHPRCLSVQWTARRPVRFSTSCYQPVECHTTLFVPSRAPFGVDVPSGPRRVDCP
jgi:hypothetical protein